MGKYLFVILFFIIIHLIASKTFYEGPGFVMTGNVNGSNIQITETSTPVVSLLWRFPQYHNGYFLSKESDTGNFLKSIDGYKWTEIPLEGDRSPTDLAIGEDLLCIIAENAVYTSTDPTALNWSVGQVFNFNLTSLVYAKEKFFMTGNDGNLYVGNKFCSNWKSVGLSNNYGLNILHWTGHELMALSNSNSPNNFVLYSSRDGIFNWTSQTFSINIYGFSQIFTDINGNTFLVLMTYSCCAAQIYIKRSNQTEFSLLDTLDFPRIRGIIYNNEQTFLRLADDYLMDVSFDFGQTWNQIFDGSSNSAQPYIGYFMLDGEFLIFGRFE